LLFALLLAIVPPRGGIERYHADAVRYASIADDLAAEVHESGPINGLSEWETALLLVSIAVHESGLRADVDEGRVRGGGRDGCLLQIRGFHGSDRRACLKRGLELARASWWACPRERLAAYASGSCSAGLPESRAMVDAWQRWRVRYPGPVQ
jgi:hypothetical protein